MKLKLVGLSLQQSTRWLLACLNMHQINRPAPLSKINFYDVQLCFYTQWSFFHSKGPLSASIRNIAKNQKNPIDYKKFQKIPKHSKRLQKIPKESNELKCKESLLAWTCAKLLWKCSNKQNTFLISLSISELTTSQKFFVTVWPPGGAAINLSKSPRNQNRTTLLL